MHIARERAALSDLPHQPYGSGYCPRITRMSANKKRERLVTLDVTSLLSNSNDPSFAGNILCHRNFRRKIHVLYRVQQLDTFGHWALKRLRPEMRPVPPPRLLMTAVRTASARSLSPFDSPPELIRPHGPYRKLATW